MYEQRLQEMWVLSMKRTLTALTIAASLIASGASAYDSKTLEVLENLSNATLADFDRILGLPRGTLEEQTEKQERLRSAQEDWKDHYMPGVDLSSAKLSNIYLMDINLREADLSGSNLSDAYLPDANLIGAILRGANLSGANLRGANLLLADLTDADLSSADLEEAELTRARMNGAILCNTTMPDDSVIYSGC